MQCSLGMVSQSTLRNAGVPVTADTILHTPFESLAASAAAAEQVGLDAPEHAEAEPMAVDAEQPGTEATETHEEPGRTAAQSTILSRLLEELIHHSKPEVRLPTLCNLVLHKRTCKLLRSTGVSLRKAGPKPQLEHMQEAHTPIPKVNCLTEQ